MVVRKALVAVGLAVGVVAAQNAVLNITLDDTGSVYLNGTEVDVSGRGGSVPVQIVQGDNVLAVAVRDAGYAGGFAASIDLSGIGTADTVISDGTWKVSDEAPQGWTTLSYDASSWMAAGAYGPIADDTTEPRHTLYTHGAEWLWTPPRVFMRKSFTAAAAGTYTANIQGNGFSFKMYLNGALVGEQDAMVTTADALHNYGGQAVVAGENVLAVDATCLDSVNMAYVRGGLFTGAGPSAQRLATMDTTWKYSFTEVTGWNNTGFDDAAWKYVQAKSGTSTGGPFVAYKFIWPSIMYFRLVFSVPVAGVHEPLSGVARGSRVVSRVYYTLDGQRLSDEALRTQAGMVTERAVLTDGRIVARVLQAR